MLIGEASTGKSQNKKQQALTQVSAMNGIANATYLSGIMISLFAFGIPISPAAAGPGGPLFDPANGFIASLDVTKKYYGYLFSSRDCVIYNYFFDVEICFKND